MAHIGEMKTLVLANGAEIPGVVVSQPWTEPIEFTNRAGRLIKTTAQFADLVTLRETEDGVRLVITPENMRWADPRFNMVDGLDYDSSTGALLTLEEITKVATANKAARAKERFEARQAAQAAIVTVEEDEDEEAPAVVPA